MRRQCHYFVPEKFVHTFAGCMLYQFAHPMEVTNFVDAKFSGVYNSDYVHALLQTLAHY